LKSIYKYTRHKFLNNDEKWYPIVAVYYLTYRCEFRCKYCSDGEKTPYYELAEDESSGEHAFSVLKKIRNYSDYLVLTGGEPLSYPHLEYVMQRVPELKFKDVAFTTNGFRLDRYLDSIADSISNLIVSIDTMDSEKANSLSGMPNGTFTRVLKNLELARKKAQNRYEIYISSVATSENIKDLYEVYRFAEENRYTFAVQPQLVGVRAHDSLFGNSEYTAFYDFLIDKKLKGGKIYGTIPYLKHMRELRKFSCSPFTMLVVTPKGDVFYPCLEIGHKAGNILDYDSLHDIKKRGAEMFGPPPDCDNRCQSACALGFSTLLKHPISFTEDALLNIKGAVKRKLGVSI